MTIEKRKRGRPKGSTKPKIVRKTKKQLKQEHATEQGQYKFITGRCPCVFYKHFVLGPMFCVHHYPMYLETDTRADS